MNFPILNASAYQCIYWQEISLLEVRKYLFANLDVICGSLFLRVAMYAKNALILWVTDSFSIRSELWGRSADLTLSSQMKVRLLTYCLSEFAKT